MKKFKKNYIGKGTKVENMDIVKVTLKIEEVLEHKHEFEGNEYITFEVAKMQNVDKFGRSHTAYVSTREETEDEKSKKKS
jgi:hypothetical protein